jgi:hypothetical protein
VRQLLYVPTTTDRSEYNSGWPGGIYACVQHADRSFGLTDHLACMAFVCSCFQRELLGLGVEQRERASRQRCRNSAVRWARAPLSGFCRPEMHQASGWQCPIVRHERSHARGRSMAWETRAQSAVKQAERKGRETLALTSR